MQPLQLFIHGRIHMILRNIVFIGAAIFSGNLLAQASPPKAVVTPNAALAPNAAVNTGKLIKPPMPAEPEIKLSVFVFDGTNNPASGVEVTQNGNMWGNCKWGGINAQPVSGQPSTKLCKFSAARGTKINVTPSPGSPTLAGLQCNPSGTGACYKTQAFELLRDGHIEAAFNIKP
jgi:hypothetical protein